MGVETHNRPSSDRGRQTPKPVRTLWLPLAVAIAGVAASLVLWDWLRFQREMGALPRIALGVGSVIAILLAVAVGLAQSARGRARDAEAAEAGRRESEARTQSILDATMHS